MSNEDKIELDGVVTQKLPNAMFDVTCNDMTVDEALAIARSVRKIIR